MQIKTIHTAVVCLLSMLVFVISSGIANANGLAHTRDVADSSAANSSPWPALTLPDTAVVTLPDSQTGRSYQLWLSFPSHYDAGKAYPLLLVTDADYAFPLIRSIRKRLGAGGQNIQDFLLVAVSYAQGDSPVDSRNRDYTPVNVLAKGFNDGNRYGGSHYGEAKAHSRYLRQQVLPFLQQHWRIDAKRQIFVGHSYGALLGSQILFDAPRSFSHYVLSSPSFWFGNNAMFAQEQHYAKLHQDLPAQLWFYAASFEQTGPTARHATRINIVADTARMQRQLTERNYPSLQTHYQVIEGEDHLSVFPHMISDAMLKILPGSGPYTPG